MRKLRGPVDVAPVAQGRDGDADNVGDFLDGQQFVVGVGSDGHSGPLDVARAVPPGGLPVAIREVRRMSFLLHKDCGQVPVVNGEEKEASPPLYPYGRTPWGYVGLVQSEAPPEVAWTSLPSRLSPKCRSPDTGQNARHHLEQAVLDQ
jgi:hypothetical protein